LEHEGSIDPDIEKLNRKAKKGAANVVTEVLGDPEIQAILKKAVLKETFTSGLVMAAFFLGLLNLYNTAKTVFNLGWIGDCIVGLALTGMGSTYMIRNFLKISNGKTNKSKKT